MCLLNSPMGNRNGSGLGKAETANNFPGYQYDLFTRRTLYIAGTDRKPSTYPLRVNTESVSEVLRVSTRGTSTCLCRSRSGRREMASNTDQILPDGVIGILRPGIFM